VTSHLAAAAYVFSDPDSAHVVAPLPPCLAILVKRVESAGRYAQDRTNHTFAPVRGGPVATLDTKWPSFVLLACDWTIQDSKSFDLPGCNSAGVKHFGNSGLREPRESQLPQHHGEAG
jgi:hypothetical protein